MTGVAGLPRPIGYVLGGGASLGAIQVGMLQALSEYEIVPDLVAGTSVGSLNGAALALDPTSSANRLSHVWARMTTAQIFPGGPLAQARTLQRTKTHLFPNTGLAAVIDQFLGGQDRSFDDLAVPFAAVTMDVATGRAHPIRHGPLLPALLASAAVPGIYPRVDHAGRRLYDGGIVANVPMRVAVDMGARSLVVLDCAYPGQLPTLGETFAEIMLFTAMVTMRTQAVYEAPLVANDVPVVYLPGPAPRPISPLDFSHSHELIEAAYEGARRSWHHSRSRVRASTGHLRRDPRPFARSPIAPDRPPRGRSSLAQPEDLTHTVRVVPRRPGAGTDWKDDERCTEESARAAAARLRGTVSGGADPVERADRCDQLVGRVDERARLDALLDGAVSGVSGAVVVSGPPGIGKSSLLDCAVHRAAQFRILRVAGLESEMAFGYAGVHQLVGPILDHIGALAGPQRDALDAAFGRVEHEEFDPFVVALAVLSLLGEASRAQPVLTVVDDAQWLDDESATVIAFVARRLRAERVAMLVAVRGMPNHRVGFERLPRLHVEGLSASDARALVASAAGGVLDDAIADRIVTAAGGNPLALVELPKALTEEQLRGAVPLPDPLPIGPHLSTVFTARVEALSASAQTALLLAAAEQMGDLLLFRRAASTMPGFAWDEAVMEAEASGLVRFAPSVSFRHPLVRSAVYYAATPAQRRLVHAALAGALDAAEDVDRRAWHLGAATIEPDEQVASALEASAGRAQRRGGSSVAADYLWRAAELTPSPERATSRLLEAARAELVAGQVLRANEILARARAHPLDARQHADAAWTEALIKFVGGHGRDAVALLADVLPTIDHEELELATGACVAAVAAALAAGHLVDDTARRAIATGVSGLTATMGLPAIVARLLDALAARWTEGPMACAALHDVVTEASKQPWRIEETVGLHLHVVFYDIVLAAAELLDDRAWDDLVQAWVRVARRTGAMTALPVALSSLSWLEVLQGHFGSATSHLAEIDDLRSLTSGRGLLGAPAPAMVLREAWQGNEEATRTGVRRMMRDAHDRGLGIGIDHGYAALTVLELGAGKYEAALHAARRVADHDAIPLGVLSLADLVEAAARAGRPEHIPPALERLTDRAATSRTPWARATLARACAVATTGDEAEEHFAVALDELSKCSIVTDRARTQLAYGEWLRRARRKREARSALDESLQIFETLGAAGFAARARAELAATGAQVRTRSAAPDLLTPQEAQIARLAAAGERNHDIAAQLFITTSTVEYHLRKVFMKLGVGSRTQLARVDLPS